MTYRRWFLLAATVAVVGALAWVLMPRQLKVHPTSLRAIAAYVERDGKPQPMPSNAAKYFGLGDTELEFREARLKSPSGAIRGLQVRRNGSGAFDIFLISKPAGAKGAYHFRATPDGALIKSCYFQTTPVPLANADELFAEEVQFWLTVLREKQGREAI